MHSAPDRPHSAPTATVPLWQDIREALRGTERDYTAGPVGRAIVLLAVPMVLEMSMESIFAVVDAFFVGRLGAAAVATIGLVESLMIVIYTVAMGLSTGLTAIVARRIGEKDGAGAARAAVQGLLLGLGMSTVLGVLGTVYARDLLAIMGADAEVLRVGPGFARLSLAGNASVFLLFVVNAAFRGAGDAAIAMRALILGNAVNIALAPLLIFGWGVVPALGLEGAAIATIVGRGLGFLWAMRQLLAGDGALRVHREHLAVELGTMRDIVAVAGWGVVQYAISSASWIGLVRIIATFGGIAVAGYTIAIRILLFVIMPAYGVAAAAATMVGQSLGAKDPDRAARAVWVAARINMLVLGATTLLMWVLAPSLVRIFTDAAAVATIARDGLRTMALGLPLFGLGMVLEQSFNGAGDTRTPSWLNFGVFWLFQIPLAWTLCTRVGLGPEGAFISVSIAYSVLALTSAMLFRRGTWRERQV